MKGSNCYVATIVYVNVLLAACIIGLFITESEEVVFVFSYAPETTSRCTETVPVAVCEAHPLFGCQLVAGFTPEAGGLSTDKLFCYILLLLLAVVLALVDVRVPTSSIITVEETCDSISL